MHIQFAELPVADPARAIRFYTENLGCRVAADAPLGPDGWRWVELGFAGADTTLHFVRRAADAPGDMPVLVLVDDDVAATVARLEAQGVEILAAPHNPPWQPGRTMAEFRDSEGNRMVLGSK
jgi:catechol 2,3-dioxygenase-like lactoylglutathione lyase family enzyme